MRYVFISLFIIFSSCYTQTLSTFDKVVKLDLNQIDGNIKTYYSDNYKKEAETNLNLVQNSINFFEDNFHVNESFSLAIIDSVAWRKITNIPYGLPFVSGPPYIICIPANTNNVLSKIIAKAIDGYELDTKYGITNEEMVKHFVSLIGFHELGHLYAKEYGISFPNKWTFEFAATYFAYFYLDQYFPRERDIWIDVAEILVKELNIRYTTINDFEKLYVKVGVDNYAWYQVVFLLRVKEVYKGQRKEFLLKLKNYEWPSKSSTEYLNEMENLSVGFNTWAQKYHLK